MYYQYGSITYIFHMPHKKGKTPSSSVQLRKSKHFFAQFASCLYSDKEFRKHARERVNESYLRLQHIWEHIDELSYKDRKILVESAEFVASCKEVFRIIDEQIKGNTAQPTTSKDTTL